MGRIMTVFDIDFGKYEEKCHAQHMEVEFNSDVYPPRIVLTQEQTLFDVGTQQEQTRETEIVVVGGVEPQITVKGAWETTRKRLNKMVTEALKLLELYLHAYMQDHMEYEAAREGGREA